MAILIKHVQGNVLCLNIPLTVKIRTIEGGEVVEHEEDFYPDTSKPITVSMVRSMGSKISFVPQVSGNVLTIRDSGMLKANMYGIEILCQDHDGNPYRYKANSAVQIVDATRDAGIVAGIEFDAEEYTLEGAVFISYGVEQVQSDWAETDTEEKSFIKNKPDLTQYATKTELREVESKIPTLPDHIVTDEHYVHTDNNYTSQDKQKLAGLENYDDSEIRQELGGKVDKVQGKGLSTNDYTDNEKQKLSALPTSQQLEQALAGKQDVINDLDTIRSGAQAGATAYQKPQTGIPSTDLAQGVIPDVSNFITKSVDDLVNYYLKSETYTKAEVQALINAVKQFTYEVVSVLPTASADTMHKIYLVPSSDPQAQNVKDEYITIDNGAEAQTRYTWEQIGSTAIDLSGYYTSQQTDTAISTALNTALADYTTTANLTTLLAGKQDKIDSSHKLSADLIEDGSTNKAYTADEKTKLNNIEQGAQVNVKPDWNAQSGSAAEILNKPTIPDAQIQSDWNQSNNTQKDFIKNKPTTMGASGIGHKGGFVPDTPSTAGTTKFLREDGTWDVPAGGSAAAYTPTLQSAPTSSTTTYTKDGQTVDFEIGQFCRVANQDGGYDFYQLYDLTTADNVTTATWEKQENDTRELLMLNLTTDQTGLQEDPLLGTTVRIVTLDEQQTEVFSGTWQGSQISVRINTYYRYKILLGSVSGYITPITPAITPLVNNVRSVTIQYVKGTIDTIYIDDSISDPAAKVTGDVNGTMLQVIRSHFHRYLAKYRDGKLKMCPLNDSNSLLFWDNTTAKTDGTMGDVFVTCDIPFYTHYEQDANGRHVIKFSVVEQDGWKEWHFGFGSNRDAIGAYEMTVKNGVGRSVSGSTSTANIMQGQAVQYATMFGGRCVEQRDQNIIGTLFYALYGHTNCQLVCGYGTNSVDKIMGGTDSLGMTDTVGSGGNGDNGSINFLGLENWWGNKAEWMGNIGFNVNSVDYKYAITEPDGTTREVQGHNTANQHTYKRGMWFGENLDLIGRPDSVSGTDSTGYCDSNYHGNKTARVVYRSSANSYADGGVAYSSAYYASSNTSANIGSRLAFRGTTELVEDVAAFLAL